MQLYNQSLPPMADFDLIPGFIDLYEARERGPSITLPMSPNYRRQASRLRDARITFPVAQVSSRRYLHPANTRSRTARTPMPHPQFEEAVSIYSYALQDVSWWESRSSVVGTCQHDLPGDYFERAAAVYSGDGEGLRRTMTNCTRGPNGGAGQYSDSNQRPVEFNTPPEDPESDREKSPPALDLSIPSSSAMAPYPPPHLFRLFEFPGVDRRDYQNQTHNQGADGTSQLQQDPGQRHEIRQRRGRKRPSEEDDQGRDPKRVRDGGFLGSGHHTTVQGGYLADPAHRSNFTPIGMIRMNTLTPSQLSSGAPGPPMGSQYSSPENQFDGNTHHQEHDDEDMGGL